MIDTIRELAKKTDEKILMVVLDGVGGLPMDLGGDTELATAKTPNLDALAASRSWDWWNSSAQASPPVPAPAT